MAKYFYLVILFLISFIDHVWPQARTRTVHTASKAPYRGFKLLRMDSAASLVQDPKYLYEFLNNYVLKLSIDLWTLIAK